MRKIKEILRLKRDLGLSNKAIARSIGIGATTVGECLRRVERAKLSWPLEENITDEELEKQLYSPPRSNVPVEVLNIDWLYIHQELRRKGVTRELLWLSYKEQHPDGICYSRFCDLYKKWKQEIDCCMRQNHKAGEKLFVDYAGLTIPIIADIDTGEMMEAQIFVAALGASNYTYAEATASQSLPDWIGSHTRAFSYFGGVPEIVVPDNLKSGVHKSHRYEPDLNPTYADMAEHYGVAVIPARVAKPKDKGKVEQAVQHVERRILARLRDRTFFSVGELNDAIKPLLEELNEKGFQKLPGSRKSQFETLEKPTLQPLPAKPYAFAEWKKAKLGLDYHIALDSNYYSAPYTLIQKKLDVRYTVNTVEVFHKSRRVASHRRCYKKNVYITLPEHMPKSHREHAKWTPGKIINWAKETGAATTELIEKMIVSRRHPQQAFRSSIGIIRLASSFTSERLEKACQRALAIGSYNYKSVKSILKNGLDQQPLPSQEQRHATEQTHEYIRGKDYFK